MLKNMISIYLHNFRICWNEGFYILNIISRSWRDSNLEKSKFLNWIWGVPFVNYSY